MDDAHSPDARKGESWTCRYEAVRADALDYGNPKGRNGLGVLIHRGMVAWMRTWPMPPEVRAPQLEAMEVEAPAIDPSQQPHDGTARLSVPSELRQQIVNLISNMILGRQSLEVGP